MGSFEGKTAVVTGAGRGIGEAVACRFAAEGATVALIDCSRDEVAQTARRIARAGGRAFSEHCDVSDAVQARSAVDRISVRCGHIHALVNCAGIDHSAPFLDIKPENWDRVLAVNLKGTFLVSQAVARNMKKHGTGAIVSIASIDGHAAERDCASYCASKAALYGLTRTAAVELAPFGIRVNSVSPGYTDTAMAAAHPDPETLKLLRSEFRRVPIKRMLRVEEVAAVCLFLASDEASGVTGADLVVDGGTLANAFILDSMP